MSEQWLTVREAAQEFGYSVSNTQKLFHFLAEHGCSVRSGPHFSRRMRRSDVEALIARPFFRLDCRSARVVDWAKQHVQEMKTWPLSKLKARIARDIGVESISANLIYRACWHLRITRASRRSPCQLRKVHRSVELWLNRNCSWLYETERAGHSRSAYMAYKRACAEEESQYLLVSRSGFYAILTKLRAIVRSPEADKAPERAQEAQL